MTQGHRGKFPYYSVQKPKDSKVELVLYASVKSKARFVCTDTEIQPPIFPPKDQVVLPPLMINHF